ncbi:hypothetical protein KC347_g7985 [Hortaea werneckii]|nr:hypothetical protein KC347_g7985 [Hortaea werneckii]
MGAPQMPARFPCWCKATYSWGGETKKDLGFIEGDLIEALNAGDGQWWVGRLRRDPRAIGSFPSNFVEILAETFQPAPNSRAASPLTSTSSIPQKSQGTFRKPFSAHQKMQSVGSLNGKKDGTPESDKEKPKPKSKFKPYSSMKTAQAPTSTLQKQKSGLVVATKPEPQPQIPQPPPRGGHSRRTSHAPSPQPSVRDRASASPTPTPMYGHQRPVSMYRAASPQPGYRAPSPQPMYRASSPQPMYRAASPQPMYRAASPQPMYRAASPQPMQRAASPQPMYRAASPQPMYRAASPQPYYRTPSPAPPGQHSPLPATYHDGSAYPQILPNARQLSQSTYQPQPQYGSRAPSPAPSFGYEPYNVPSPDPEEDEDGQDSSPPPPPPPAHRVAYQPSRAPSMAKYDRQDSYGADELTPAPPSPNGGGSRHVSHMTPSPLRDAMNDVMSSLQDMSMYQDSEASPSQEKPDRAPTPTNVWSPDEFELVRRKSRVQHRAQSSLGFNPDNRYAAEEDEQTSSIPSSRDGPPVLGNYVQRMERQLRHAPSNVSGVSDVPPQPPLKGSQNQQRPGSRSRPNTASSQSSADSSARSLHSSARHPNLKSRKSAYELGRQKLGRTYTTKTDVTNSTETSSATQSSTSTQLTSKSVMSGYSAGGFSATSAGSLARHKFGLGSQKSAHGRSKSAIDTRSLGDINSSARSMAASEASGGSGPSYHESHASYNQPVQTPVADWTKDPMESAGLLGGLGAPKAKKSGFFKKMIESAKTSARTGAASARSTVGDRSRSRSRTGSVSPSKSVIGAAGFAGGTASRPASAMGGGSPAKDTSMGGGSDWMQVRRDVNRSNSVSRRERDERAERAEMLDLPVVKPIDQLLELVEGDESLDGLPVPEPTDFNTPNLALVDKSTRFIQSLPPMVTVSALAQNYICRPHRSDVQRLRAIFTWVAERITWEEDFEGMIDTRRVIQAKRGCSQEIAMLVREMCTAVGLYAEEVHGYLKSPGEVLDLDMVARPNHWWNAIIVDGEWRIMDCSLANPTNPRRGAYSTASSQVAENWYFLARPMEICYTHIPLLPEQQHLVPPVDHETLIMLPCATPAYFRNGVELAEFNTSMQYLEQLEMAQFSINVPEDVECIAETEARAFAHDVDGDLFESGDIVKKRAFAQPEWISGRKRFTIKALLPGDEGQGVLKIYAGKRGLMHSIKDNPHPLALALPLSHTGQNPPYDFHLRHPTPHAQRHDLYVAQPQCARLTMNNTFVFCIRQHPSSLSRFTPDTWGAGSSNKTGGAGTLSRPVSPAAGAGTTAFPPRPGSAMSMVSATHSQTSTSDYGSQLGLPMTPAQQKPAKLAIQTPSQKILRLTRKQEHFSRGGGGGGGGTGGSGGLGAGGDADEGTGLTTSWETVIKIGERGTWRGLVLADRSARWCVFAEWECV